MALRDYYRCKNCDTKIAYGPERPESDWEPHLLCRDCIHNAIEFAVKFGGIDGDHHKAWVIDQMVRTLAGSQYSEIIAKAKAGEDGPATYEWNTGIAP